MEFTEGSSLILNSLTLGKHTLFESDFTRLERKYPDSQYKYRAHLLSSEEERQQVREHINDNLMDTEGWMHIPVNKYDELVNMPLRQNGKSKHGYSDTDYILATTRRLSPPNLFLPDQTLLDLDAERHSYFYTGARVNAQVCPLLYEDEEAGTCGVSLILEAIVVLSGDKEKYPPLDIRQRRNVELILQSVKPN